MKTIIVLLSMIISYNSFALNNQQINDAADLMMAIKNATKGRWEIKSTYSDKRFEIKSKKSFRAIKRTISGPLVTTPRLEHFTMFLTLKEKLNPKEYSSIYSSRNKRYRDLLRLCNEKIKYRSGKGVNYYLPESNDEWQLYFKLTKAEKAYKELPQYYYKSLGFQLYICKYKVSKNSLTSYALIKRDLFKIIKLFNDYDSEKAHTHIITPKMDFKEVYQGLYMADAEFHHEENHNEIYILEDGTTVKFLVSSNDPSSPRIIDKMYKLDLSSKTEKWIPIDKLKIVIPQQ